MLFSILLILGVKSMFCQNILRGKVIDSENRMPLNHVEIINIKSNTTTITDYFGEFEVQETGTYRFKKTGYISKDVEITDTGFLFIQLNINPSELNEVVVNANLLPLKLKKAVATISIVSSEDIQKNNSTNFNTTLNRVPGVFMQSGSLNTNKITIRGIGSRTLYGTSKIRAYFLDIPLTSGSGTTNIEDFELGAIAKIEIIKGSSSIYGAGLGGTIHLQPQQAHLNQTTAESTFIFGSFGLFKNISNVNHGSEKHSFVAIYSHTESGGYRENNNYDRQTFTLNSNHFLSKKDDLSFLASYVDLKAFIPSSIDETTFKNKPKSAAFTWKQSRGYEDSRRGIFGLSWNHQYIGNLKQTTSIFTSFKKSYEPRPFNILQENTMAIGIRSRLIGSHKLFNKPMDWTIGGELFKDSNSWGTFENLYENFPPGTGSVEGNRVSEFKENRKYYNLFFETNYSITKKTTLSLGLNFNETSYDLKDKFIDSNPDQSGTYNFGSQLSPKLGVSHLITNQISLYTNASHGFSPPTLEETLLPDGLINTNIKPETGWNFEIGTRASLIKNRLQVNAALYHLNIENLLVARRAGNDQFIGVNAGKTTYDGLELSMDYHMLKTEKINIKTVISYTRNNFKFKEFIDDLNDYSGNKLTGVPSEIFNAGMDIASKKGIYGNLNFQHVSSMPITDSNAVFADSYNLVNMKAGYKMPIIKKLTLHVFIGVDNIFDTAYASQILINASGFGGSAPRYYYPGNPINYYTGINIHYNF